MPTCPTLFIIPNSVGITTHYVATLLFAVRNAAILHFSSKVFPLLSQHEIAVYHTAQIGGEQFHTYGKQDNTEELTQY